MIGIPTRYVGVFVDVLSGAAYFSGVVCCGRVARYGASQGCPVKFGGQGAWR